MIVFLDISLRPTAESFDDITDIIPRCIDALKSSPRMDHRVCKRYLETLIPFWMALKPQLASDGSSKQTSPPDDRASPPTWMTLESSWTNTWTHGQAYSVTDDLLCILKEPCGGVDHEDWAARSWDWRFLLPSDSIQTVKNTGSITSSAGSQWLGSGHKRKAKRSKGDDELSDHSQASYHSPSRSGRSTEGRDPF